MGVEAQALRRLHSALLEKIRGIKEINQSSEVRPTALLEVFRVDEADEHGTDDTVKVDCGPLVLYLCERANRPPSMYVAVDGWIRMERSAEDGTSLRTVGFGTRVGYFRQKAQRLQHVYGVHYDMDENGGGHPVFHAQLRPMRGFANEIQNQFRFEAQVDDPVRALLRNVRTPTAQMDFMSVLTQLCADHLLDRDQTDDHSLAFSCVRSACTFLLGAAHRLPYLSDGGASRCYRSSHWYGT